MAPVFPIIQLDDVAASALSPHPALFDYLLRLGDDSLILGQRLTEWCGHAPALEIDLSLANIGLDLIGQATLLLNLAGEIEGKGRDGDKLAFHRDVLAFRNCLAVEQPNGDFAEDLGLRDHLLSERVSFVGLLSGREKQEGIAAFREKRSPRWQ